MNEKERVPLCFEYIALFFACRLHNLVTSRQQDKQNLAVLERKLAEERKTRSLTEQQLSQERKAKKSEEAARVAALANRYVNTS